jgi:hypothetical protein
MLIAGEAGPVASIGKGERFRDGKSAVRRLATVSLQFRDAVGTINTVELVREGFRKLRLGSCIMAGFTVNESRHNDALDTRWA